MRAPAAAVVLSARAAAGLTTSMWTAFGGSSRLTTSPNWVVVHDWNAIPSGDKTTEASQKACEAKCAPPNTQFTFNPKSRHCYCAKAREFGGHDSKGIVSGYQDGEVSGCGTPLGSAPCACGGLKVDRGCPAGRRSAKAGAAFSPTQCDPKVCKDEASCHTWCGLRNVTGCCALQKDAQPGKPMCSLLPVGDATVRREGTLATLCAAPAAGSGGGGGVSGGGVFLILFFVGGTVYFAAGFAYNYQRRELRGADAVPHRDFWVDLPHLVRDGAQFAAEKARGVAGRAYSAV